MRTFHISFPGHYLGGEAIVTAEDPVAAVAMLLEQKAIQQIATNNEQAIIDPTDPTVSRRRPLKPKDFVAVQIDTENPNVILISDGNY